MVEIETGARDPGLNTLRSVLRGSGADLDLRLAALEDHDAVLEKTLDHLTAQNRARLEQGFDRFLTGLTKGLATSRPLVNPSE